MALIEADFSCGHRGYHNCRGDDAKDPAYLKHLATVGICRDCDAERRRQRTAADWARIEAENAGLVPLEGTCDTWLATARDGRTSVEMAAWRHAMVIRAGIRVLFDRRKAGLLARLDGTGVTLRTRCEVKEGIARMDELLAHPGIEEWHLRQAGAIFHGSYGPNCERGVTLSDSARRSGRRR